MASIGCLPSRTHVHITSDTGSSGTLPPATAKQAGCMTADHAIQLEELWRSWHLGGAPMPPVAATPITPEIPKPAAAAPPDSQRIRQDPREFAAPPPAMSAPDHTVELQNLRDTVARLATEHDELAQRIVTLEQAAPVPGFHDDGDDPDADAAGFARRFAAAPPPVAPVAPVAVDTTTAREIAALTARLAAFEKLMEPEATAGPVNVKGDAITRLRIAGADRRRKAAPGNGRDMALALKLSEVAHLARSAQSGPMDLMSVLGEARNGLSWDQVANDIAHHSDAWARVCVRSYAVELAAEHAIETAHDKDIPGLVDSAVDIISKIEG